MRVSWVRSRSCRTLSGLAVLAVLCPPSPAETACPVSPWPCRPASPYSQPAAPAPTPSGQPPAQTPSGTAAEAAPGTQPPATQAANEPSLSPERFGAVGGENVALASPNMIGDFLGYSVMRCLPVAVQRTVLVPTQVGTRTVFDPSTETFIVVPIIQNVPHTVTSTTLVCQDVFVAAHGGAFRIGENESPRPEDRVFVTYNFYGEVPGGLDATGAVTRGDVNRELFGFEKTLLDGDASIGLRVPALQQQLDGSFGGNGFGDLSVVTKYAFLNDRRTGDLLSGGLVVTAPTGPALVVLQDVKIHSTLLQPWLGFIVNADRVYAEGFSSVVFPTDARDVTLAFNDLAVGYRLYTAGDGLVRSVIPTLELHVTTPLNHRGADQLISVPDLVDLTAGAHLGLAPRSMLTLGVNTPVAGPRPYTVEAVVQFNWRF